MGAAGDEFALDHRRSCGAHHHRAAERLDQAGGREVDAELARHAAAGVHVDAAVGTNGARDRDDPGRRIRLAEVDDRAALAGIDRIRARGNGAASRRIGRGDLREAQSLGATAGRGNAKLVIAGQHQTAIVETDRDLAGQRRRIDGRLQILHQRGQALRAATAAGPQHDVGLQVVAAVLDRDAQRSRSAEVTIGIFGETVGDDLLRPGRRQHRHVASGRQRDAAVFLPGAELDVAPQHQALVTPRIVRRRLVAAAAATHVDGLASEQIAPEADLLVGADADHRVAAGVAHRAAEVVTGRIVAVDHLAA